MNYGESHSSSDKPKKRFNEKKKIPTWCGDRKTHSHSLHCAEIRSFSFDQKWWLCRFVTSNVRICRMRFGGQFASEQLQSIGCYVKELFFFVFVSIILDTRAIPIVFGHDPAISLWISIYFSAAHEQVKLYDAFQTISKQIPHNCSGKKRKKQFNSSCLQLAFSLSIEFDENIYLCFDQEERAKETKAETVTKTTSKNTFLWHQSRFQLNFVFLGSFHRRCSFGEIILLAFEP